MTVDLILRALGAALLLFLGACALGAILEARSREAAVDLAHDDGYRLRPWVADKYAGRSYRDVWPRHWRPASEAEWKFALEAGWDDAAWLEAGGHYAGTYEPPTRGARETPSD